MSQTRYQRHSFVLRIWEEEGVPWRGWVQHAGSQEQAYVQNVEELLTFLQDYTAGRLDRRAANGEELSQGGDHA